MVPLSRGEVVDYIPPEFSDEARAKAEEKGEDLARFDKRPVYKIAPATLIERTRWKRDLAAQAGRFPTNAELYEAARVGVKEVVEDEGQPALLEIIDSIEALELDPPKPPIDPDDEKRHRALLDDMGEIEKTLVDYHPPYAELVAQRQYWTDIATIAAAAAFLRGWDNVDLPFRRVRGRVPEDLLAQLDQAHLTGIGTRAMQLMQPNADQAKNSEPPSPSPCAPETSAAESDRKTAAPDGKSAGNSTKRTRASRSTTPTSS